MRPRLVVMARKRFACPVWGLLAVAGKYSAFRGPDVPEFDLRDSQGRLRERIQIDAHLSLLCTHARCTCLVE